jgi:hypothetical protein
MSKYLILLIGIMLMLTAVAQADAVRGAIPPGGWGRDCTQWTTYTDPWNSGELCYDPLAGGGALGWHTCPNLGDVVWPALNIELWVEMECVFHWHATHAQIHRISNYDDVVIYLDGGSCCNNGQYIITTPPDALPNLDFLPFVQDMWGRTGPNHGTNIPLAWAYSLNGAPYAPMIDLPNDPSPGKTSKYFLVPVSCNDWTMRITGDLIFHQGDGYYYLGGPGAFTCPAEPL